MNSFCNEPDTFYGDGRIWVVTVVLHNVLHMLLYIQEEYMAF